MIWAIVSLWLCFCWLYRAPLSLATKNIVKLILVLTIWWCLCVQCSLVLEEGVCYNQCILLAKFCQLMPCFILYSNARFTCYSRDLLTSYFYIPVPYDEMDVLGFISGVSSRMSCRSLYKPSTSTSSALVVGAWTWIIVMIVMLNGLPWKTK